MSTSGSMDDLSAIVTRLSKELELMGLPGLASSQVDYGGAVVAQEDVIGDLISSSYDLIGLLRDLQRSKRQREDHAQQLIHDLQRSQWLLDKEKELSVQREREAAEAYEKERQANVRLQLSETLLKKKSEEHRQLAHECQLKENQWLHALRRRDQENHRLHQQLLKFLHTKSTGSSGTGIVPLQVEMRGSLVAPARASSSDSTRLRKQWGRTAADDAKKLVEAKWKSALNSLEKDHRLLRDDYFQLVDMVGRFLTNCSTKLTARRSDTNLFSHATEWIQLPVVSMRDRLEQVFRLVEASLVSTTFPRNPIETGQSFDSATNSLEIDYVTPIATNRIAQRLEQPVTASQLLAVENPKVATNNCISPPIIKDEVVAGVTSRSGISTTTKSAAQRHKPLKMVKSIHSTSTTGHQFDGLPDPYSGIAFRNPGNNGSTQVVNQVDWNEAEKTDSPPAACNISQKSSIMARPSTSGTASSSPLARLKESDELPETDVSDEMATLDTPCPSASNSRSGSCSSSSSVSSWKSQQCGIDPAAAALPGASGIDERFLRACSDAASSVRGNSRRISCSSAGPSISPAPAKSAGTASTLNLNRRTITARVSFVQQEQATATPGGARHHPGDPVDLQCCLTAPHSNSSVDT